MRYSALSHVLPIALVLSGCAPATAPPPKLMSQNVVLKTTRSGYVYALFYFTEDQIADRRWERQRQAYDTVKVCKTGKHIVQRDIRWFDATPQSGRRCAAAIYKVQCDIPTLSPKDRIERIHQSFLTRPLGIEPIEKDCGEKDRSKRVMPTSQDIEARNARDYAALISPDAHCPAETIVQGALRVTADTRFGIHTLVHRDVADLFSPRNFQHQQAGAFAGRLNRALDDADQVEAYLVPPSEPANPVTDIQVTQIFARNDRGGPYCVTLRAERGADVWQKTIVRPSALPERPGMTDAQGLSKDRDHYWTPTTDIRMLAGELVSHLTIKSLLPAAPAGD